MTLSILNAPNPFVEITERFLPEIYSPDPIPHFFQPDPLFLQCRADSHFYMGNESQWRMASARMLTAEMAKRKRSGEQVLATGDFNSTESDAVTRWFKSGTDNPFPLRDSYRDYDPNGRVTTGFGVKLDYIYLEKTSPLRVLKSWVVTAPAGASDHIPICATLAW